MQASRAAFRAWCNSGILLVASNYESACTWDIYSIATLDAIFEVTEKSSGEWQEKNI